MSPGFTARQAAAYYRRFHGWNPLPSLAREKRPALSFHQYWDTPVDELVLDQWRAPNIQIMTGVRWGLAVVDLDGVGAVEAWRSLTMFRPLPKTWIVFTGCGNYHLYFQIPNWVESLPYRIVWEGSGRHEKIELIGDNRLVIAPPSRHVDTGIRYEFLVGPQDMPEPAPLPLWVLGLPDVRHVDPEPIVEPTVRRCVRPEDRWDLPRFVEAIPDKVRLVRDWGLRLVERHPNGRGWVQCRAIGREDAHPSAGFNVKTGYYCEPFVRRASLFDLSVLLGVYRTFRESVEGLMNYYGKP